jgi:hypothetical protein
MKMKNINKKVFYRDTKYLLMLLSLFFTGLYACREGMRYEIGFSDSEPPDAPEYVSYKPLYGGARLFYRIPSNEDLLSIDAAYLNPAGRKVWFSVSYFSDSIDVYGLSDTLEHVIQLYSVDRAGNKSENVPVTIKPLTPAYRQVADSLIVKAGFSSFYLDWVNELKQSMNIYVDFSYTRQGQNVVHNMIYTSYAAKDRWFIRDLEGVSEPVRVKVRVEDTYGNITETIDMGEILLLHDELIPKDKWYLPEPNDSVAGVPMAFLQMGEARKAFIKDGIIDEGANINYVHTGSNGRTGLPKDGLVPWNVLIDLGDEYEISRIVTHQRYYTGAHPTTGRGAYYGGENVGVYNMYILDADTGEWEYVSQHKITVSSSLTDLEYMHLGREGDMAYLYPDDPKFSRSTRWFRYEALYGFGYNYTDVVNVHCLSEITLYGKKN